MTFNCRNFQVNYDQLADVELIQDVLEMHKPDVVFLQEFHYGKKPIKELEEMFKSIGGYEYAFPFRKSDLAIFSNYPLSEKYANRFENSTNGFQQADIEIKGNTYRIFNVHLQTNSISELAHCISHYGSLKSKHTWLDIFQMLGRYRDATRIRVGQAEDISEKIAKSSYPVFLCGDFNDVPQSFIYRKLGSTLTDTFSKAGQGLGITYVEKIPWLRIDYIFAPKNLSIQKTYVGKSNFSDHRPVITHIKLP